MLRASADVRPGGSLHRRIALLERVQQPTTQSKLDEIQSAALAATSLEDLELLEQLKMLELAGKGVESSVEQSMAVDRLAEAFTDAFVAAGSRLAIPEIDQLLEA